ncbi:hypothetical protein ACFVP0_26845 [Streptomyces cinereoruber]|uniref:hypothetical protein n=1 Tax=Streptomyces cinereoruber TaxID=67260 RepID=UPI003685F0AD
MIRTWPARVAVDRATDTFGAPKTAAKVRGAPPGPWVDHEEFCPAAGGVGGERHGVLEGLVLAQGVRAAPAGEH